MFSMVFGTKDQALGAARKLHHRHAAVRGVLTEPAGSFPAGTSYRANDREVLQWVHSTLVETAIVVYEMVLSTLTAEERDNFYRESCRFAGLFGLPSSSLPPQLDSLHKLHPSHAPVRYSLCHKPCADDKRSCVW